jgi:hypothetical protein
LSRNLTEKCHKRFLALYRIALWGIMMFRILALTLAATGVMVVSAGAQTAPVVGGDTDAHGCIGSAGYSYSTVKAACIRMWEVGIELLPLKPQGTATFASYIVFASGRDGRRAELFLYGRTDPLILEKTGFWAHTWKGQGYVLSRLKGVYSLAGPDGQVIYQGATR